MCKSCVACDSDKWNSKTTSATLQCSVHDVDVIQGARNRLITD